MVLRASMQYINDINETAVSQLITTGRFVIKKWGRRRRQAASISPVLEYLIRIELSQHRLQVLLFYSLVFCMFAEEWRVLTRYHSPWKNVRWGIWGMSSTNAGDWQNEDSHFVQIFSFFLLLPKINYSKYVKNACTID